MTSLSTNPSAASVTPSDIEMREERQTQGLNERQRIIVDANDTSVQITLSKKPQVPQEATKKAKVIMFIAEAHRDILEAYGLKNEEGNINLGDQIHNNLFTAYNVFRQRYNQTRGRLEQKIADTDYTVTFNGRAYTLNRDIVHNAVFQRASKLELNFAKYEPRDPNNWYDIAGPLLNFLSGFSLRVKELRLGHNTMPIGKDKGQEKAVQLAQYGIYGCHHILCEGVTFPPEKRASMVQSLGPLTALICYLKTDRRYNQKYKEAVKRR